MLGKLIAKGKHSYMHTFFLHSVDYKFHSAPSKTVQQKLTSDIGGLMWLLLQNIFAKYD